MLADCTEFQCARFISAANKANLQPFRRQRRRRGCCEARRPTRYGGRWRNAGRVWRGRRGRRRCWGSVCRRCTGRSRNWDRDSAQSCTEGPPVRRAMLSRTPAPLPPPLALSGDRLREDDRRWIDNKAIAAREATVGGRDRCPSCCQPSPERRTLAAKCDGKVSVAASWSCRLGGHAGGFPVTSS